MTLTTGQVDRVAGRTTTDRHFEQYVLEHRQRLYRLAVMLSGDTVLAGDLLTDVLGRVYERWARVSAADDVHAYVRRMLVNEFISWKRRRARTSPHADVGELLEQRSNDVPGLAEQHADRKALLGELSNLPPRQRAAIVLRYYQDLSDDDIAATLGCRVGTVRSNISRGLAALRVTIAASNERTGS